MRDRGHRLEPVDGFLRLYQPPGQGGGGPERRVLEATPGATTPWWADRFEILLPRPS
jgi:hypothetical protein